MRKKEIAIVMLLIAGVYLLFNVIFHLPSTPKYDEVIILEKGKQLDKQWLASWEDTRFILFFLIPLGNVYFARFVAIVNLVLIGYLLCKYTSRIGLEHAMYCLVFFVIFAMKTPIMFTYTAENFIAFFLLIALFFDDYYKRAICLAVSFLFKPIAIPFIIGLKKLRYIIAALSSVFIVIIYATIIGRFDTLYREFIQTPIEWIMGIGMYEGTLKGSFLGLTTWHENFYIITGLIPITAISYLYIRSNNIKLDSWIYFVIIISMIIWCVRPTGRYLIMCVPMMCIIIGTALGDMSKIKINVKMAVLSTLFVGIISFIDIFLKYAKMYWIVEIYSLIILIFVINHSGGKK